MRNVVTSSPLHLKGLIGSGIFGEFWVKVLPILMVVHCAQSSPSYGVTKGKWNGNGEFMYSIIGGRQEVFCSNGTSVLIGLKFKWCAPFYGFEVVNKGELG